MQIVEVLGGRTLTGRFIALEPLEPRHHAPLAQARLDPSIWTHMPYDLTKGVETVIASLAESNASGDFLTYAVRRLRDGELVGSTSYLAIAPVHAKVEIGATWYAPDAQASAVNPEAKYLLLQNAFARQWNRVEFKTDFRNARSRAALKKLGAREEGVLRAHMWMPQGYFRDSVYFSVLASEWPAVKAKLEDRLKAFA